MDLDTQSLHDQQVGPHETAVTDAVASEADVVADAAEVV